MISELSAPLTKSEIEFRVGTTTQNKGFSLLIYKTARTDTKRLNDVCGMLWKPRYYYDDKKNLCCGISIYDKDIKEWIERVDVGTESNTEKEKGSYSDSFKRAGFKWGIGSELYNSPFIWLNWSDWYQKNNKSYPNFRVNNLEVKEYIVKDDEIVKLELTYNGKHVYSHGKNYQPELSKEDIEKENEEAKKELERKEAVKEYKVQIGSVMKKRLDIGVNQVEIKNSVKKHLGVNMTKDCNDLEKLKKFYLHLENKLKEDTNKGEKSE